MTNKAVFFVINNSNDDHKGAKSTVSE